MVRSHVWYFVLSDCNRTLAGYSATGNKLNFEITMTNSDGSHFSVEENGFLWPYAIPK